MGSQARPVSRRSARAGLVLVVITTVLFAGVGPIPVRNARGAPGTPTPISSCRTIDSPGTYALTGAIATENDSCLSITASNVVLDGNQYPVTGNGSGRGIAVESSSGSPISNVTVRNVTVTDWGRGIAVEDASGGTIRRAIAGGNDEGIAIADSERVRVLDSTATSNIYGIYLDGTTDSRVHNSTARQNKWGVALEGGSVRNRISRTVSTDNSQWDLHSRAESRNNTASAFDTGSGTFSLASTNVRARGSYTGSNVFRSPLAPPAGWNATGTYLEADPIGDTIDGLTAAYTGNAPPSRSRSGTTATDRGRSSIVP